MPNLTVTLITNVLPGVGIAPSEADLCVNFNSVQDGVVAHAGGGQANAVLITGIQARVTTVATAADSVRLPPAIAGMSLNVLNGAAANAMNVFPSSAAQGGVAGGDNINALAVNTALSCAAQTVTNFYCITTGTWWSK